MIGLLVLFRSMPKTKCNIVVTLAVVGCAKFMRLPSGVCVIVWCEWWISASVGSISRKVGQILYNCPAAIFVLLLNIPHKDNHPANEYPSRPSLSRGMCM